MKTTTLLPSSVVLFGLVALAATSVHAHAQGVPFGNGVGEWGGYGGNSGSNPYNSNPNSNNDGNNSNNDNNSNSDSGDSGGSSDGDSDSGSTTGTGSGSSTSGGNGYGNGNSGGGGGSSYGGGSNTGSSGGLSPSFGFPTDGFDIASVMNFPVAHGALAATAFGFLFPLGAILVRVAPGRDALFAHGFLQVLAYAAYVAGAGLGLYLASIMHMPGSGAGLLDAAGRNAHPIIGIVLLVALFFQPLLGAVHHARFKRLGRRTWVSHVHLWTGRLGITLGIINGGLGFALAGTTTGAPVVAYAVVSGVMWLLWLLTALRGEYGRARAQGKARKKEKIIQEDRGYVPGVRGGSGGGGSGSGGDSTRPSEEHAGGSSSRRAYPPPDAAMDVPSPPYTPGPHYEAHMAHVHQEPARRDMPNMKEVMDRSDTVSYLSASHDEMNRGQV
ncbi:hypothetical protein ANO14919_039040 [Xylariales sp. No.14919]|nr:hypothetical protein ANO14919_039040 [Xylariales sp. No.14919]